MRFLIALILVAATFVPAKAADGMITLESANSVSATADKLEAAIDKAGATVFARVDHMANASSVDMELPPTTLVIFGNPKVGTPIIAADRRAGLDLPVRILIWQNDNDTTMIGYLDPQALKTRYSISGADDSFEKMTGALKKLTGAAAK